MKFRLQVWHLLHLQTFIRMLDFTLPRESKMTLMSDKSPPLEFEIS